jgi:hypothetical protein
MILRWPKVSENQEEIARLPGDANLDHIIRQQRGIYETARTQRSNVLRFIALSVWKDPRPPKQLHFPLRRLSSYSAASLCTRPYSDRTPERKLSREILSLTPCTNPSEEMLRSGIKPKQEIPLARK